MIIIQQPGVRVHQHQHQHQHHQAGVKSRKYDFDKKEDRSPINLKEEPIVHLGDFQEEKRIR